MDSVVEQGIEAVFDDAAAVAAAVAAVAGAGVGSDLAWEQEALGLDGDGRRLGAVTNAHGSVREPCGLVRCLNAGAGKTDGTELRPEAGDGQDEEDEKRSARVGADAGEDAGEK